MYKRLRKEAADAQRSTEPDLVLAPQQDNLQSWRAWVAGPTDTPFEGGVFKVKLVLPSDYPSAPPKGYFLTRIYHPNISKAGEICVNTLKKDWQSSLGIGHVLQVVRCLLINPFPESALNEEAGKLFMEDYDAYFKKARMLTEVHALVASKKGEASGSSGELLAETSAGGPVEKKQKPVNSEKREKEKKKSLKRL